MLGLAPYVSPNRPHAPARWWVAAVTGGGDEWTVALSEQAALPTPQGVTALAAPCSLPRAFLAHLKLDTKSREHACETIGKWTTRRLAAHARVFAKAQQRGSRHPARCTEESLSVLDRRRLALFHAALPLLTTHPTTPWSEPRPPFLFECDVTATLRACDLPAHALRSARPDTVLRRQRVVDAFAKGCLGTTISPSEPGVVVASVDALRAFVAGAMSVWFARNTPPPPSLEHSDAWIPLP